MFLSWFPNGVSSWLSSFSDWILINSNPIFLQFEFNPRPTGVFCITRPTGGGYFEPPPQHSDLRNYWTDSKNSSGIWKPWKKLLRENKFYWPRGHEWRHRSGRVMFTVRKSEHVTPLFEELEWASVDVRVSERDIAMVHRLLNRLYVPQCLRDSISYRGDVSVRETRAAVAGHLQLPRVRTEMARRFFGFRAPSLWNEAPADVKEAKSSALCRRRAAAWLMARNVKWHAFTACHDSSLITFVFYLVFVFCLCILSSVSFYTVFYHIFLYWLLVIKAMSWRPFEINVCMYVGQSQNVRHFGLDDIGEKNCDVKHKQSQLIGMDSVSNICMNHLLCFAALIEVKVMSGHQVKKVKQKQFAI